MALYFKEPSDIISTVVPPVTTNSAALDLALPKPGVDRNHHRIPIPAPKPQHPQIPQPIYCTSSMGVTKIPLSPSINTMPPTSSSPEHHHSHWHHPHTPLLPGISTEAMCEMAARILFHNVRWSQTVIQGSGLALEDQLTLLESSWRELFLLTAAQLMPGLDPTHLIPPGPNELELSLEVNRFRSTLLGFHALNLDAQEFDCIRALVLFKAGLDATCEPPAAVPSSRSSNGSISPGAPGLAAPKLKDPGTVGRLRDRAQLVLGQLFGVSTLATLRYGKILLLLPALRSVQPSTIEELFFRRTIGSSPIESVICNMYYKPTWDLRYERSSGLWDYDFWVRGNSDECWTTLWRICKFVGLCVCWCFRLFLAGVRLIITRWCYFRKETRWF